LQGDWKAVRLNVGSDPGGPLELYNLTEDPAEANDVAASHPDLLEKLSQDMEAAREASKAFNF